MSIYIFYRERIVVANPEAQVALEPETLDSFGDLSGFTEQPDEYSGTPRTMVWHIRALTAVTALTPRTFINKKRRHKKINKNEVTRAVP